MATDAARPSLDRIADLAARSVEIIRAGQAPTGAFVACPNFPPYRYSWLRDGSFIADAMSRVGETDSAEAFFGWCAQVVVDRQDRIESLIDRQRAGEPIADAEFLNTRYTVDGRESTEDWSEFQLDGYGTWLWALDGHRRRHGRLLRDLLPGAELSARYVAAFRERPCFDWWEETVGMHGSTLAALFGGLTAAASWEELGSERRHELAAAADSIREQLLADAGERGAFAKVLGAGGIDASLLAVSTPFGVVDPHDPRMRATLAEIERTLVVGGGVHRHPDDIYFGGGQWLLLAALLGWHHVETGRTADAWTELDWIVAHANPAGELPEQVPDHLLAPDHFGDWPVPVAIPLLWSHAMFLVLADALGVVD